MSHCPRCDKPIDSQAINCPYCNNPVKAFGHPGIPLYQADRDEFLCDRCIYHQDDTCNYPQRPYAKTCTLFRDITATLEEEETSIYTRSFKSRIIAWVHSNRFLLGILFLLMLSIILTVIN
ncbi:MAG: zinc ribbon domain-containing protein [Xenococcaceae cyanobacterium MO_234.B1]|nr:zinc ribbon domain-containing protein [Xenococcaceae cyanobacterium MO_234.B1]